jgi:hypothetical protein
MRLAISICFAAMYELLSKVPKSPLARQPPEAGDFYAFAEIFELLSKVPKSNLE